MWALRRSSFPLRRGIIKCCSRSLIFNPEIEIKRLESQLGISDSHQLTSGRCLVLRSFCKIPDFSLRFVLGGRGISSQAGSKSSGEEDDLEDDFSELGTANENDEVEEGDVEVVPEDELGTASEFSGEEVDDDDQEECDKGMELPGAEAKASISEEKRTTRLELFRAIRSASGNSLWGVLDKWVQEGKDMEQDTINWVLSVLCSRSLYAKALLLSEWLENSKQVDFVEKSYACRLNLIARVRGIDKAERYLETIPESFRGELVYCTLLCSYVARNNLKKAEALFYKMKDLFPVSADVCNQLILLYLKFDKRKIVDVLLLMEKENVKPNLVTYTLLIDTKGSHDITGMEGIVETMKAEGIEPDIRVKASIAKHYITGGLKEKAEAILKEIKEGSLKQNRRDFPLLLPLYAELGNSEVVERLWKICESRPTLEECTAAIESWGKLKKVEEAEAVFERMLKSWQARRSSRPYAPLLKLYTDNKMLTKAKDLIKQMEDNGCMICSPTLDELVKLYIKAGELEKATSELQKAVDQNKIKPLCTSYMALLDEYAKKGDVHNSETTFKQMKQMGYTAKFKHYESLIKAYINAKASAYGMRERLKADGIDSSKKLASLLTKVDPFRSSAVADLFD